MFTTIKNYFKSFSVAGSLDQIKDFFQTSYSALQKVILFVSFAKDELEKNNVGANVLKVIPQVLSVVGTIVSLIAKFGPVFGLNLPASAPSKKKITAEDLNKALGDDLDKLNKL